MPTQNGSMQQVLAGVNAGEKIDAAKKWTMSAYKYTKQLVSEKMGKRTRTVDTELEKRITVLRETQQRYQNLLKLARQFQNQFTSMMNTQKLLSESFAELSMKSPELQDEFTQNANLQKVLTKNGEGLRSALEFFVSSLQTLATKTIEDTISTIRDYENARVQFDAYRTDLEANEAVGQSLKTEEARKEFNTQRETFHGLRENLQVKLRFLEENKVKVMRKQLLLLHNALAAYFSGNKDQLESTMKEFHIRVKQKGEQEQSFLETH